MDEPPSTKVYYRIWISVATYGSLLTFLAVCSASDDCLHGMRIILMNLFCVTVAVLLTIDAFVDVKGLFNRILPYRYCSYKAFVSGSS